jgi:hypothetical protein
MMQKVAGTVEKNYAEVWLSFKGNDVRPCADRKDTPLRAGN